MLNDEIENKNKQKKRMLNDVMCHHLIILINLFLPLNVCSASK